MDNMLEKLKEYGADITGAMGRFLNDVDLYKTCFQICLEDEAFEKLGQAIAAMEYDNAFEYAHALKGITGNMGLMPLYQVIHCMVEDLRRKEYDNLQSLYAEICTHQKFLEKLQK
ncbi:MAG: Hpt domain-containing protein [Christensenellaceae bacterium]